MNGGRKMRFTLFLSAVAMVLPLGMASRALSPAATYSGGAYADQSFLTPPAQPESLLMLGSTDTMGGTCSAPVASFVIPTGIGETVNADKGKGCEHGIRPCAASQVGRPCDPNRPGIICTAQANGAYCCLAYAP
jgi:hypothetical protein